MGLGNRIVSVVCAICLAVSFVAAGFVAVAVPDNATTSLADTYAGTTNPTTPFSHEELCDMALAGKRYTFDKNDRFALNQAIYDINVQAEADGRAHRGSLDTALWDEMAARDKVSGADAANAASTSLFFGLANTFGGSYDEADDLARMRTLQPSSENVDMLLAQASDTYVLDPEAIEHLDDVFGVLATAEPVVLGVFIAAVLTAVGVGCASGRRTSGQFCSARVWERLRFSPSWEYGPLSTSKGCSPCSTACSLRRAAGCSAPTRCSSPCTPSPSGSAWEQSGLPRRSP